jgi:hypothetical protein
LDLGKVVCRAGEDRLVDQGCCVAGGVDQVDIADGFLGQPGGGYFVVWVADPQSQQHPVLAFVVEAFGAGQQQLADPIQRIVLSAPMPFGGASEMSGV